MNMSYKKNKCRVSRVVSVLNKIGEYQNSGSEYQSCISEGFHKALNGVQQCKNESEWKLNLYEGTLQNTSFNFCLI